jgi:hypothetical protein
MNASVAMEIIDGSGTEQYRSIRPSNTLICESTARAASRPDVRRTLTTESPFQPIHSSASKLL